MSRFGGKFKIIIDDLELTEAQDIAKKIREFVEDGEIEYSIQDCISVVDLKGNTIEEQD